MSLIEAQAEQRRLEVLHSYNILDTLPQAEYDELTQLASHICGTPISLVSLLDTNRQWFKSAHGLAAKELPRQYAFCEHVLKSKQLLEVQDARLDTCFKANPYTVGEPNVVFYAGAPLVTPEGEILGTLCVIDHQPHTLSDSQKESLKILARQVVTLLELRRNQAQSLLAQQALRKANEQLAKDHQLIRAVVNTTPAGLVLFEAIRDEAGVIIDFRYLLTNPANATTTQRSVTAMMGQTLLALFPGVKEQGLFDRLVAVSQTGEPQHFKQHYQADELNVHIEATLQAIGDNVLFTFQDVSSLVRQNQELESARKVAEQALQARDAFLANVSHELRTPLNSILGFSELLGTRLQDQEEKGYLNNIQTAGRNLLQLINSLLDLAKVDSGQLELEKSPTSLLEVTETVTSLMTVQASKKDLQFIMQLDPALPQRVETDPLRLTQILLNLCGNAVKFTAQGSVTLSAQVVELSSEKVNICFQVCDTGIGIAPDRLTHIFERYTQSSASVARNYGGTGLGLNIVRSLVEQLGGSIVVTSEPGKGTSMSVNLPFTVLSEPTEKVSSPSSEVDGLQAPLEILLVEDNVFNQKLVTGILATYGVRPQIVNNGLEALAALRQAQPDIVLMDIQMPLMNGYQTARHIRHTLGLKLPIIAMTANAMASEQEACLKVGMDDYLSKPFTKAQLLSKLNKWQSTAQGLKQIKGPQRIEGRLDQEYLAEAFGEMPDLLPEMLEAFVTTWPTDVKGLSTLLESGQTVPFKQKAHYLRSSLYALGMHQAADLLKQLEHPKENITSDESQQLFDAFVDITEESITALYELS